MRRRLAATLLVLGATRAAFAQAPAPDATAPPPVIATPGPVIPGPATPLPPPPLPAARDGAGPLLAGALTAFVPFVVGCALWSQSDRGDLENAGTYVMAVGFAAAPWVSHGLQGRWKRAAAFGSVSLATSAATLVAMEAKDPFYAPYANRQRVPFGMLLTSAMFAAVIGVFDSFLIAGERTAP